MNDFKVAISVGYDGQAVATGATANADSIKRLGDVARSTGAVAAASFDAAGIAARRGGAETEKAVHQVQQASGQAAFALRMLPAQMTDVAVGLASGQSPFMVLMQQGGQLKDMFGGIGPAARAVGGFIAGLVNPFTLTAAAVGVFATAAYQGRQETDALAKAILLTGNAAGTTLGQVQHASAAVVAATGSTRGDATDVLTGLITGGKVASEVMALAAEAALRMQRSGVQAIDDTVKQFEALGKSPVEASLKLNEQYSYLTASVFRQIKALEELGRTDEAAMVAQRAYADTMIERSGKIDERLGVLERGWRRLATAAGAAWGVMLGAGTGATLEGKIKSAETALLNARAGFKGRDRIAELEAELQLLQTQKAAEEAKARAEGDNKKQNAASIELEKEKAKYLDKQAQKKNEIARIEQLYAASLKDSAAVEARRLALAGIDEKYKLAKPVKTDLQRMQERGQQSELEAYYATGGEETMREVAEKRALSSGTEAMRRAEAAERARAAMHETSDGLEASYARDNIRAGDANLSGAQRDLAESLRQVAERASNARREMAHKAAAIRDDEAAQAALREELKRVNAAEAAQGATARVLWERQQELNASWQYGATQALREYGDEVDNAAARTKRAFGESFRRAEDEVVRFMRTGKASVRSFADYAINEFYRITVAQPFVRMAAGYGGQLLDKWFGATPSVDTAAGDAGLAAMASVGGAHSGALVGREATFTRDVPLAIFAGAPRYHTGGLIGPGERPIIARDGEGVFTEGQMKKLAPVGAGTQPIVIYNTYEIDARGADFGVEPKIRNAIAESETRMMARIGAGLSRGGDLAYATGRRRG